MHLSEVPRDRDSATAVRMCFEVLGVLVSSVFQGTCSIHHRCWVDTYADAQRL